MPDREHTEKKVEINTAPYIIHGPGNVQMGLVQLQSCIIVAEKLVDNAKVGAGPALSHPVFGHQCHLQLLFIALFGLGLSPMHLAAWPSPA